MEQPKAPLKQGKCGKMDLRKRFRQALREACRNAHAEKNPEDKAVIVLMFGHGIRPIKGTSGDTLKHVSDFWFTGYVLYPTHIVSNFMNYQSLKANAFALTRFYINICTS